MTNITQWGEAEEIPGTPFGRVLGADNTAGGLTLLTVEMPPGITVDEHAHQDEDQILVVISGTIGVSIDGEKFELTDGGVAFVPRGSRHSLWNDSGAVARVLDMYTPGGMERMFTAAGENAAGGEARGSDYAAAGAQS